MPAAPRAIALFITGMSFTALFLGVPLAHEPPRPGARDLVLALVPTLILMIAVARPHAALVYGLFPVSHLPLLLLRPELAGPSIYRTAWPMLAVIAVGGAYLVAAGRRLAPKTLEPSPSPIALVVATAIAAAAPLVAFMVPALGRDVEPQNAALAAVLGPTAAWYGAGRLVPRLLAPPLMSSKSHREAWTKLADRPAPKRRTAIIAVVLAFIALGLAAAWNQWGPPAPAVPDEKVLLP